MLTTDTTPPAITTSVAPAPNAAGWNRATTTVTFACTDATSGVATCPAAVAVAAETSGQTVSGTATDRAGNSSSAATVTVKLDKTAPSVAITTPSGGTTVSTPQLTITGTVSDALSGIAGVTCGSAAATLASGTFTCSVTLVAGANDVAVVATDLAGNSATTTGHWTYGTDQTPPTVAITSPTDGTFVNTTNLTVTGTANDNVAIANVKVNGTAATITGSAWTASISIPAGDGPHDIVAVATDTGGNTASQKVTVTLDTTKPAITATVTPDANELGWIGSSNVVVTFDCSDTLSGIAICPPMSGRRDDGSGLVISGTAVDRAGNQSTVSVTFNHDTTPPALQVTSTAPDRTSAASLDIQGSVSDLLSGVASVTCGGVTASISGQVFNCTVPLDAGPNTIVVQATDRAGNFALADVETYQDRTPPAVLIVSPATGARTSSASALIVVSADDDDQVASVTIGGQTATQNDQGTYQATVALTEGSNTIAVTAVDRVGNTASASVALTRFSIPFVAITAPADFATLTAAATPVSGTVSDPSAQVVVNGVAAVVAGGTFQVASVPLAQGRTVITATATSAAGHAGTANVNVYRDSIPPRLTVVSPADGSVVRQSPIDISGNVDDIVIGTINAGEVEVIVNGARAEVANRSFVARGVVLTPGANTITLTATDRGGNTTTVLRRITFDDSAAAHLTIAGGNGQTAVIRQILPQALTVRALRADGTPAAGVAVTFRVTQNDGFVSDGTRSSRVLAATTDATGIAALRFILGNHAGAGGNRLDASALGFGSVTFDATGTTGPATMLVADSGGGQFAATGSVLPRPIVAVAVDAGHNRVAGVPVTFTIIAGGGNFNGAPTATVTTDSDGRAWVTPALGPDARPDGNSFGASLADSSTMIAFPATGRAAGAIEDTTITGVVLDNTSQPVPGVTVRVEGTTLTAVTNEQGQYSILNAPVGYVKLFVDGSTARRPGTWPTIEYAMYTIAGVENTVGMPIYLLPIDTTRGVLIDETHGGTLSLSELPGFSLTIAPGSVTFPGGSRTGTVSATLVHADKMPMQPGFGQQPRFLVTIQPPGAHFDPPAVMTMPNVDGLAPGAVTEMYSFDHDLGQFVSIGTASVSEDGSVLRSNPGAGIIKAGWHCGGDPAVPGAASECGECFNCINHYCKPDPGQQGNKCKGHECKRCAGAGGCVANVIGAHTTATVDLQQVSPASMPALQPNQYGMTWPEGLTLVVTARCNRTVWNLEVLGITGQFSQVTRLIPGQTEASTANATKLTYCNMVGDIFSPTPLIKPYETIDAVIAHENVHKEHFLDGLRAVGPTIEAIFESESIPIDAAQTAAQARQILISRPVHATDLRHALVEFQRSSALAIAHDHSGPTLAAEQAVNEARSEQICTYAKTHFGARPGDCPICDIFP